MFLHKTIAKLSLFALGFVILFSGVAAAQGGGIGGAVSNVTGNTPVELSERVIKAIVEKRNQEALSFMTGDALQDFGRALSDPEASMDRLVPTDWRVLGVVEGGDDSQQRVLVQLKLSGEWPAFLLMWAKVDGEWKFSDSELSEIMEDIYRLTPSQGQNAKEADVHATVEAFFASARAADLDGIRSHIVADALKEFEKSAGDEEFLENLNQFAAGLTYKINGVRLPPAMPQLALVNYDVTASGEPRINQYMLLVRAADAWKIASMEYTADRFEDNVIEFAGSSGETGVSAESFPAGSEQRAVFESFEKIMKAFAALDIQTMLDSTTGDAREEFIDLIGDEDEISEYREYAASYRWRVIDIVIDASEPESARILLKQKYDDYEWEDSVILMQKVGGVWKMAEFE